MFVEGGRVVHKAFEGYFIERYGGIELVGHSGDQNGFISHLYIHRPSASGYIVSFNTDVSSTRDPRHTTRAVDNDLRDVAVRELFKAEPSAGGRREPGGERAEARYDR